MWWLVTLLMVLVIGCSQSRRVDRVEPTPVTRYTLTVIRPDGVVASEETVAGAGATLAPLPWQFDLGSSPQRGHWTIRVRVVQPDGRQGVEETGFTVSDAEVTSSLRPQRFTLQAPAWHCQWGENNGLCMEGR